MAPTTSLRDVAMTVAQAAGLTDEDAQVWVLLRTNAETLATHVPEVTELHLERLAVREHLPRDLWKPVHRLGLDPDAGGYACTWHPEYIATRTVQGQPACVACGSA